MTVKIKKGSHYDLKACSLVKRIRPRNTNKYFLRGYFSFSEKSNYVLLKENGKVFLGWNKVGGINLQGWKESDVNSGMMAWRDNPDAGSREFVGYWNKDGENIYDEKPWLSVPLDDESEFMYEVLVSGAGLFVSLYRGDGKKFSHVKSDSKKYSLKALPVEISTWFGGPYPAPNNIELNVRTEWVKKSNQ